MTHNQKLNTKSDPEPVIEEVLGLVWALQEPYLGGLTPETAGESDNISNYQEPNCEKWMLSAVGISSSDFVERLGLKQGVLMVGGL